MTRKKETCGLCGHTAPGDHDLMGGYADGVPLCHCDDHSCYHNYTVYGARSSRGWYTRALADLSETLKP